MIVSFYGGFPSFDEGGQKRSILKREAKYRRSDDVAWREVGGEAVLVRPKSSVYIVLNDLGSRIWKALEEPCTTPQLVRVFVEEYEVAPADLEKDVSAFLVDLDERELVVRLEGEGQGR